MGGQTVRLYVPSQVLVSVLALEREGVRQPPLSRGISTQQAMGSRLVGRCA